MITGKGIFFFIFSFIIFVFSSCSQNVHLSSLEEIEREYLEVFFRHLFQTTSAGYVLYGEKPLFLCTFHPIENTIPGTQEHKNAVILTQGINAWEKLNIVGKNYVLLFRPDKEMTSESSREIVILNKTAFKNVIKKNLTLFQFKLGPGVDENVVLDTFLSSSFIDLFKGNEALQGIVLGYGTENSLTYERGNSLRKEVLNDAKITPPFFIHEEPETMEEIAQQIEKYASIHGGTWKNILDELADFSFYTENEEEVTPKIPFSFHTESEESRQLIKEYIEAEKKVISLLHDEKFLDKVIERFQND